MNELEVIKEELKGREDIQNPHLLAEELAICSALLALEGKVSAKKIQKWLKKNYHWEPSEEQIRLTAVMSAMGTGSSGEIGIVPRGYRLSKQKIAQRVEFIASNLDLGNKHPLVDSLNKHKKSKGRERYLIIEYEE